MASVHWHYENGTSGCIPDTSDVYDRKRDAVEFAEQLFGDSLCKKHFKEMSTWLRSRYDGVTHYFSSCEEESVSGGRCFAGADYVSIRKEKGGLKRGRWYGGETVECPC